MTRREFIQTYIAYNPPVCGDETEQIKRAEMCADALDRAGYSLDFDLTQSMKEAPKTVNFLDPKQIYPTATDVS